jgi:aflatoxin B1 aldehyde reductase
VYNAGRSEEILGELPDARKHFSIATKAPGFSPGSLASQKVANACATSLAALKQEKIDLYYFHGPDRQTPLEDSCKAINDLHRAGKIARFGISNYSKAEVEEIHFICQEKGWLKPTVYQGGYNALGRTAETELFPTLRRLGMAFFAFSPLAGGFFSRPADELRKPPPGSRMDQMKVFSNIYVNDTSLKLREDLVKACDEAGVKLKDATLRWMVHHSALSAEDGVILGASSTEQMQENLEACEGGPLPESVVTAFSDLWTQYGKAGYSPAYCV